MLTPGSWSSALSLTLTMRHFSISVDIAASPERVWEVMRDIGRWHEWTPSISSIRPEGDIFAVGRRAVIKQPKFPDTIWTVSALDAGRGFTWVSNGPGVRVLAHHRIESNGSGTRVTLALENQGIFGGLLGSLTKGITQRYLRLEAEGLKARSEDPAFRHSQGTPA